MIYVNNVSECKEEKSILNSSAGRTSKEYYKYQKLKNFGTEYCKTAMRCGKYGIPLIKPYYGSIPTTFVSVSNPSCSRPYEACITCFDYDYILERMWYKPEQYENLFLQYMCFGTLDFSMKVDDPLAAQIGNKYRNHSLSFRFQEYGARPLPVVGWSSRPSFDFCFLGFSRGGAVMVSTIGVMRDERSQWYFKIGFTEMLKRVDPDVVVFYGESDRTKFPWLPNTLEVVFVLPNRLERVRSYGR